MSIYEVFNHSSRAQLFSSMSVKWGGFMKSYKNGRNHKKWLFHTAEWRSCEKVQGLPGTEPWFGPTLETQSPRRKGSWGCHGLVIINKSVPKGKLFFLRINDSLYSWKHTKRMKLVHLNRGTLCSDLSVYLWWCQFVSCRTSKSSSVHLMEQC